MLALTPFSTSMGTSINTQVMFLTPQLPGRLLVIPHFYLLVISLYASIMVLNLITMA